MLTKDRIARPASMQRITWAIFSLAVAASSAFGQTTAFTYQGQLKDGGSPANGAYDLTFRLFDADANGNQIGADVSLAATTVADGLFTVALDFGAGMFDGSPRWLEIEVNTIVLTPRQPITSTPYSQTSNYSQSSNVANYSYAPWIPTGSDLYFLDGSVGIGTATPTAKLHVAGEAGVDGIKFPDGTLQTTAAIGGGGGDSIWSLAGADAYYNAGNVGIGTSNPGFKLDTNSSTGLGARIGMQAAGGGALVIGCNPGDNRIYLEGYNSTNDGSPTEMLITGYAGGQLPKLTISAANVGIGTSSPTGKLHVVGSSGNTIYGTTSGGKGVAGLATSNFGGTAVYGEHSAAFNYGYLGTLDAGVTGIAQVYTNYGGSFANTDAGGVALKVTQGATQVKKLEAEAIGQDAEVLRLTTERPWAFKQAYFGSGTALRLQPDTGLKNFEIAAAGGTIVATFEGNDAAPRLVVNGTTVTKVLQITGADLAEKFPVSGEKVAPGTVMEIDPENPGLLRKAQGEYNARVAGVVSGANDFAAGAILGHLPGCEEAPPIALSGRVWTYCDADESAITPGDLLTTSATPGHAMKATDRSRAYGAAIGKAMTSLPRGQRGLVLVLVNLQ